MKTLLLIFILGFLILLALLDGIGLISGLLSFWVFLLIGAFIVGNLYLIKRNLR